MFLNSVEVRIKILMKEYEGIDVLEELAISPVPELLLILGGESRSSWR
jgi:hypothetical protein